MTVSREVIRFVAPAANIARRWRRFAGFRDGCTLGVRQFLEGFSRMLDLWDSFFVRRIHGLGLDASIHDFGDIGGEAFEFLFGKVVWDVEGRSGEVAERGEDA